MIWVRRRSVCEIFQCGFCLTLKRTDIGKGGEKGKVCGVGIGVYTTEGVVTHDSQHESLQHIAWTDAF